MEYKESDRLSKSSYFGVQPDIELNTTMFLEDLSQNVVPIFNSTGVICTIEPNSKNNQSQLAEILPFKQNRRRLDVTGLMLDIIDKIATHVVYNGFIVFEKIKMITADGISMRSLELINGTNIKFEKQFVVQTITESSEAIRIPKKKCYIIEFPKSLGGQKEYFKLINEIRSMRKTEPMMQLDNSLREIDGYNIVEHKKRHDLELRRLTKDIGWNHRDHNSKYLSSYYQTYRLLKFKKSKVILRDYLIDTFKSIVEDVFDRMGERVELKIEGLITLAEIEEAMIELREGRFGVDDLRKYMQ